MYPICNFSKRTKNYSTTQKHVKLYLDLSTLHSRLRTVVCGVPSLQLQISIGLSAGIVNQPLVIDVKTHVEPGAIWIDLPKVARVDIALSELELGTDHELDL